MENQKDFGPKNTIEHNENRHINWILIDEINT